MIGYLLAFGGAALAYQAGKARARFELPLCAAEEGSPYRATARALLVTNQFIGRIEPILQRIDDGEVPTVRDLADIGRALAQGGGS